VINPPPSPPQGRGDKGGEEAENVNLRKSSTYRFGREVTEANYVNLHKPNARSIMQASSVGESSPSPAIGAEKDEICRMNSRTTELRNPWIFSIPENLKNKHLQT
jgi:hypothetical protein